MANCLSPLLHSIFLIGVLDLKGKDRKSHVGVICLGWAGFVLWSWPNIGSME